MSVSLSEMRRELQKPKPSAPVVLTVQAQVRVIPIFVRRTARYRSYTATGRGIVGACLAPYLQEGDAVFVDPTIEPRDSDLVCVLLSYIVEREHFRHGPRGEEVVPATVARRESIKVLRIINGERWLVTLNDGAVRFEDMLDAEIVGTVTAWHRQRWWRRPAMWRLAEIEPAISQT